MQKKRGSSNESVSIFSLLVVLEYHRAQDWALFCSALMPIIDLNVWDTTNCKLLI